MKKKVEVRTDEEILKAIEKNKTAEEICTALGITLSTLQGRVAKLQQKEQRFIHVDGLYPERKTPVGQRKDPRVNKSGDLFISKAWLKDQGFNIGDSFSVKFGKDKITLTKKAAPAGTGTAQAGNEERR
jgi:hypothetical protein